MCIRDRAWKEGIGQSLTYAELTDRKAIVIVYIRTEDDKIRKKDERGLAVLATTLGKDWLADTYAPRIYSGWNYPFLHYIIVYTNRDTGEWWFAHP